VEESEPRNKWILLAGENPRADESACLTASTFLLALYRDFLIYSLKIFILKFEEETSEMKRFIAFNLVILLALFSFMACGKKAAAPKAGTAKAQDILGMIPADVLGVFFVDVHRAMTTEVARKTIQEQKDYQKYQEFIEKTGVDPQKDIYFLAAGIMKGTGEDNQEGVGVVNLKYDKDAILALIKEKIEEEGQELMEEQYENFTLYKAWEKDESGAFSFINDSNVVVGNEAPVKAVLDVLKNKKDNVFKNEKLSALIDKTNKDALFWGAMLVPPEAMEQAASENPMMGAMKEIESVALYFDYKNQNLIAEIMAMSPNAESNKKVAEALNGIKAFGGMAAAEKPEIGELLNKIEITSTDEYVKIYASIPEELVNKIKELAAATEEKE
jgi:hypothetical protein